MSATIEQLSKLQDIHHPNCFVCGKDGLGVNFEIEADGAIEAKVACRQIHQGYNHILHGGMVTSLLDAAMVNCLFAHGVVALTAEIKVRFRYPVAVSQPAVVRAKIIDCSKILYNMTATLIQCNTIMAKANGKFIKK
jgi:acyl-coenzyme A thioesterase PaaI-like protein